MKFCRECNNLLYPKADPEKKELLLTCRLCNYFEKADDHCIFKNDIMHSESEKTRVLQDVASDPTLPRTKRVTCGMCGHQEAVFFQASDSDGMALFFVCTNQACNNRWREES
eukprot:GCRY01002230.1.p1 GENE.GCRY01002230.1~~GCRY01002230.1.p1  ORF type:complete len:112 (+),score=4.52 GCRY01002230.1:176-511(+)